MSSRRTSYGCKTWPPADDPKIYIHALGHQQVNDAWVVAVARHNRGRLVTFDSRLPAHALADGQVEVISGKEIPFLFASTQLAIHRGTVENGP